MSYCLYLHSHQQLTILITHACAADEDEIIEDLKARTGGKPDQVRKVGLRKYASVSPSAFGLSGKKRVALLRTSGAIVGASASGGGSISADGLIPKLRALAKDKGVAAVVLRVDSPGGDALASDLMWREIKALVSGWMWRGTLVFA